MENLNLGYQDKLEDLKHIRKLTLFLMVLFVKYAVIQQRYTNHSTFSSVIQKNFAMAVLSVNRFHLEYCRIYVSEIQHRNYTIKNVMHNPLLYILISTFKLQASLVFLRWII